MKEPGRQVLRMVHLLHNPRLLYESFMQRNKLINLHAENCHVPRINEALSMKNYCVSPNK